MRVGNIMSEVKVKKSFLGRILKFIIISISSIVVLAVAATVTVVVLLSDKTRFSGKVGTSDTVELIKKNYIEGFKDTASTGKFSFSIPEEDINSVLNKASKTINNKYVETIYYGRDGEKNHHYFYIDLNLPVITSRVVIDTVAKANKDLSITLDISEIKLGKINAYKFIKERGILSSSLFDSFFKDSKIPITFSEKSNSFTAKPLGFIDNFPKVSTISTTFFRLAKEIGSPVIKVEPAALGFTLDFSKFRSSETLLAPDYSSTSMPEFRSMLDTACNDASSSLTDSEPHTIASITYEQLDIALTKSASIIPAEEVTSSLTTGKVINKLASIQTKFVGDYKMNLYLVYSFNGYLVDAVIPTDFSNSLANDFNAYFDLQYEINVGEYLIEDIETNPNVIFFINNTRAVLGSLTSACDFFVFDTDSDSFGFNFSNFAPYSSVVQTAIKDVELDPNRINFIMMKA